VSQGAAADTSPTPECWKFARVGDGGLLAPRRDPDEAEPNSAVGLQFGFKLPTGPYDVANSNGVVAERSLQPGTGSTDLIAGVFLTRPAREGALWFAQASFQWAVATREDYRPGNLLVATGGYRHPLSTHVTGIIQVNATVRPSDSGANAEPDVTGSQFLFVSPGVSWDLSPLTGDLRLRAAPRVSPHDRRATDLQLGAGCGGLAAVLANHRSPRTSVHRRPEAPGTSTSRMSTARRSLRSRLRRIVVRATRRLFFLEVLLG